MHISYIQEYGIPGGRNDVYSVSIYTVKNMTVISLDSTTYLLTYLQQLAGGVVGLMHYHTHMPQNLSNQMRV